MLWLNTAALSLAIALAVITGTARASQGHQPLVLEATIPLHDVSGRIDHMAVDLARRHLFIAELGNDAVDVIDLATATVIHRIAGLKEPQGVAFLPAAELIVVANAGDGSVQFFRGADFAPAGMIALGDDADNVRVVARTGNAIVGYGNGGLAFIDPQSHTKRADITLPGHPESFQLSPDGTRAFVNIPDLHRIAVIDLAAKRPAGTWSLPDLRSNFPMAIDAAGKTLAVVFRSPARLALIDASTGVALAVRTTCGDADDVFFDERRQRIYISCGEGSVDVFQGLARDVHSLARIDTSSGGADRAVCP